MSDSIDPALSGRPGDIVAVYVLGDLIEGAARPDALVMVDWAWDHDPASRGGQRYRLFARADCGVSTGFLADAHPVTVAAALRQRSMDIVRRPVACAWTPMLDAAALAERIMRRRPLTPGALLADPAFVALATAAARAGKTWTRELLAWERRPAVEIAVAHVREVVDAERSLESAESARRLEAAAAVAEREQPVREAVMAAYDSCDYRVCAQGHIVSVAILDATPASRPGCSAGVSKGDRYSSRCTYRKVESAHTLRVRADWLDRTAALGVRTLDGMLVLDAAPLGHTADGTAAVYRVTLARQGRGTSVEAVTRDVVAGLDGARRIRRGEALVTYTDERVAHDALIDAGVLPG